ncbi:MAG: hypothetical protein AAGA60_22785 [Cyanobacteria bacterium P01_E01_bin.42]
MNKLQAKAKKILLLLLLISGCQSNSSVTDFQSKSSPIIKTSSQKLELTPHHIAPPSAKEILLWKNEIVLASRSSRAFGLRRSFQTPKLPQLLQELGHIRSLIEGTDGNLWGISYQGDKKPPYLREQYKLFYLPSNSHRVEVIDLPPIIRGDRERSIPIRLVSHPDGVIVLDRQHVNIYTRGQWRTIPLAFLNYSVYFPIFYDGKLFFQEIFRDPRTENTPDPQTIPTLAFIDLATGEQSYVPHPHREPEYEDVSYWNISGMAAREEEFWIITRGFGKNKERYPEVFRWSGEGFELAIPTEKFDDWLSAIDIDSEGGIWLAGQGMAYHYDRGNLQKIIEYPRSWSAQPYAMRRIGRNLLILGGNVFVNSSNRRHFFSYQGSYSLFKKVRGEWRIECPRNISEEKRQEIRNNPNFIHCHWKIPPIPYETQES